MKVAIMQPYIFPYIGYYQLVNSVDGFVFYDDVNFIKRGYVNRNNILTNGQAHRFTIPVPGGSQNKKINEHSFDFDVSKILRTIEQSYKKARFYDVVYPIIESVLTDKNRKVENICSNSIKKVFDFLEIEKKFFYSSDITASRRGNAADKLINICRSLDAKVYINSVGGLDLYDKSYFQKQGVELKFIRTLDHAYNQSLPNFVPNLSMIDVMMWNDKDKIKSLLQCYELI